MRIPGSDDWVFNAEAARLCRLVVAPVCALSTGRHLLNETVISEFSRDLRMLDGSGDGVCCLWTPPLVVIDVFSLWQPGTGNLDVHGPAYLIDGAVRLARAAKSSKPSDVQGILHRGGSIEELPRIRETVGRTLRQREPRPSLALERLIIGIQPRTFTVLDDVRVVPTARGYTAGIRVRCDNAENDMLLLCGALSLKEPFEASRARRGTLEGSRFRVRKQTTVRTSPYVVEESRAP